MVSKISDEITSDKELTLVFKGMRRYNKGAKCEDFEYEQHKSQTYSSRSGFFYVRCDYERVGQRQLANRRLSHLTNKKLVRELAQQVVVRQSM